MQKSTKISRRTFFGDSAKGLIALGLGASGLRPQKDDSADFILMGAPILTVDSQNAVKQALAVKGNRIIAVENNRRSIMELAGPGTKILQIPRKHCVTPGMIDVHNHIVAQASSTIGWVDLIKCNNAKQVRETLAQWILDNDCAPGTWVRGAGYMWLWDKILKSQGGPPLLGLGDIDGEVDLGSNRVDLSQYPIYLVQLSGHYGTANALALKKAKVIDDSGGFYSGSNAECLTLPGKTIREAFSPEGHAFGSFFQIAEPVDTRSAFFKPLNGMIFHHYAMEEFISRATRYGGFPKLDSTEVTSALKQRCRQFIRLGVTSIYDNNLRAINLMDAIRHFPDNTETGEKLRLSLYPYICDLNYGAFPAYDSPTRRGILSLAPMFEGDWMRLPGYKLQLDAAAMTGFTWEESNSLGDNTHGQLNLWSREDYLEIVEALDDLRAQISIHVVGDKSLDWTLDAYENAGVGGRNRRHRIEHLPCVPDISKNSLTNTDVPLLRRARELGIIFCPQPGFIRFYAPFWEQAYGAGIGNNAVDEIFPRVTHSIPFKSAVEAGITVALSSDSPCVPNASPLLAIWEAINRRTIQISHNGQVLLESFIYNHPDESGNIIDESVDFNQALRAHTIDAAFCGFEEDKKGSLETGKLADIVVWNNDIRRLNDVEFGEIKEMKPVLTIIDGKIAFHDHSSGIKLDSK